MASANELKTSGFLEFDELFTEVARISRVSSEMLRQNLAGPLSKIRSMLVFRGEIVLPEDRSWNCVYSPTLVVKIVAYVRWHNVGSRHSVAHVVRFFTDLENGEEYAIRHLPPRLQKEYSDKLGNLAVGSVHVVLPFRQSNRRLG